MPAFPSQGDITTKNQWGTALRTFFSPHFDLTTGDFIPTIISKTYAELASMIAGETLVPGQQYRMTDFQTVHTIPNTADTHTGPAEPLILTAVTGTTFDTRVRSETYPQDVIDYELVDTSGRGGTKGRILRRVDTIWNVSVPWDWRNCIFRRYENNLGSGVFSRLGNDRSDTYQDLPTFGVSPDNTLILGSGWNVVVLQGCSLLTAMGDFVDSTYESITSAVFKGDARGNTIKSLQMVGANGRFDNNELGDLIQCNFGPHFVNNVSTASASVANDWFGKGLTNVNTEIDFTNITFTTVTSPYDDVASYVSFVGCFHTLNIIGRLDNCIIAKQVTAGNLEDWFPNDYFGKILRADGSSFDVSIDITGLTTIDFDSYNPSYNDWVGIYNLTSTNAAETISSILNPPPDTEFQFDLRPAAGLTLTISGTAYAAVNADGQILLGTASRVLVGDKRDSITLRRETVTNGNGTFTVLREVRSQISL